MLIVRSFIAEPLDDEDLDLKENYTRQGFFEWTWRDFAAYPGMEGYGMVYFQFLFFLFSVVLRHGWREENAETPTSEIEDKNSEDVERYLKVFNKKCKILSGMKLFVSRTTYAVNDSFYSSEYFVSTHVSEKARQSAKSAKTSCRRRLHPFNTQCKNLS